MQARIARVCRPCIHTARRPAAGCQPVQPFQLSTRCPTAHLQRRVVSVRTVSGASSVQAQVLELLEAAERRQRSLQAEASASGSDETQPEWPDIQTFVTSSQPVIESLSTDDLSKLIKALAVAAGETGAAVDAGWLQQFAAVIYGRMGAMKTAELAAVIWGFGELGYNPGGAWLEKFLAASKDQLQEFYSPHLCDLIWGLSCIYRPAGLQLPGPWLEAFMEESNYQLDEFPGDFAGFDLIKLVNGLAGQGIDLQERPEWTDSYLKSAYLKSGSFAESACMNQGLSRLNAGKMVMLRDSRCTFEEVNWLPRHERDMRRLMKNYKSNQWSGWQK